MAPMPQVSGTISSSNPLWVEQSLPDADRCLSFSIWSLEVRDKAMMQRVRHVFGWIPVFRIRFYLPGFSLQFLLDRVSLASCLKLLEGEWWAAGKHLPVHSTFIREVNKVTYVWILPNVCVCVHVDKISLLRPFLESWGWKAVWSWDVIFTMSPCIALAEIMFPRHITFFFFLKRQPGAHSSLEDFPFWILVSFSKSLGKCCHMFLWEDWAYRTLVKI